MNTKFFSAPLYSGMALHCDARREFEAHLAARREFVAMKAAYTQAAADIDGPLGALLQGKVRLALENAHLWRLRAAILCSLQADHVRTPRHRRELQRDLDHFLDPLDHPSDAPQVGHEAAR